jgi:hypothetical protein
MNKRNVVILGTLLVAAVIGIVYWKGIYPPRTGVEGTIGAANRYQSQQIAESDVVLKDQAVQAFIQSDTFRKLAANPEFAKTAESASFQELAKSEAFRKTAEMSSFQEAMKSRDFLSVVESGHLAEALKNADLRAVMEMKNFEAFMAEAAKAEAKTAEALNKIAESARYEAIRNSEGWKNVEANKAIMEMLTTVEMQLAKSEAFQSVVSEAAFAEMAKSEAFQSIVAEPAFQEAMKSEAFAQIAEANAITEALKSIPE